MRVCHPRPPARKCSITSRDRRMVVDTFGLALRGRPRRTVAPANFWSGVNRSSRPATRPPKPGTRGACHHFSTCSITCTAAARAEPTALAAADPDARSLPWSRRPSAAPTRVSTAASSRPAVRVVEHRDFDPLHRLARQERQRAARSRAYRARAVTNVSSIPRLDRDGPLYVFPPESLHHRHDPTSSRQCSSAGPDPLRSFRRTLLAGPQEPVEPDSRNRTGLNAWAARARRG